MEDLLINISVQNSKKNGFIVLETFYGNIQLNKSGKYKGSRINAANPLTSMPVGNVDCNLVKNAFCEYCIQISFNSFCVFPENFICLYNKINNPSMFFVDNTDKSLYVINSVHKKTEKRKMKFNYDFGGIQLSYNSDNSLHITVEENSEIRQFQPIPNLLYDPQDETYTLMFDYQGTKIMLSDKTLSLSNYGIILRNYQYEVEISKKIENIGFFKLQKSRYSYSGIISLENIKNELLSQGIVLTSDRNSVLPSLKITRDASDWFNIEINCNIDGEVVDLASRIKLFSGGDIEHKDKTIVIPDSILQAQNNLMLENGVLRIHKKNIYDVLRIIYDSNAHTNEFFSYADINLNLTEKISNMSFSYQLDGIKWLKFLFLNQFGGCLADDMGLGKTFQVIGFLNDLEVKKQISKVLIIVPKTLLTNWKREFEKYDEMYSVGIYHGDSRKDFDFEEYNVIISTYQTVRIDLDIINKYKYSMVVFDEIQFIKNHKSNTSAVLKKINSSVRVGLSGTPMENNISELWNIMDVLNPGLFHSHSVFLRRYNGKNYDELKNILSFFVLRRIKENVLQELPEKDERIIYCDMDSSQRKLYDSINYAVKEQIMRLKAFAAPVVLKGLLLLRECCCHPMILNEDVNVNKLSESTKIDMLKMLVDNLISSQHKILIFSQFTKMLALIKEELNEYKDILYYLDGKTKDRNKIVEEFEKADAGIFLISIKAGGVGLNLTSAEDVIIFDPWWNPFVEQQAIDRVYRIGQTKKVSVYKLVAANTIEEKIIDMQNEKSKDFDEIINGISNDKNLDLKKIVDLLG